MPSEEPYYHENASTDHEWEAYMYLKILPPEVRERVLFNDFLVIVRCVRRESI